jgi:hypothetical protein
MFRSFKTAVWVMVLLAAAGRALAFTIWGPAESWQTPAMDYLTRPVYGTSELGGPKEFGEGSRLNVPIITYACDFTFLSYFGTDGAKAIDAAFNVLNAVPPASTISLSKYNTDGIEQVNYSAQAMGLVDLKSTMLAAMLEHMGLLGETHVFDLRNRVSTPATCVFQYYVINRNYDPVTFNPSYYVNGRLYSYYILELCPAVQTGDAVETLVDATAVPSTYTAVATKEAILNGGIYYTTLSRDDVGGLRYLYRRDNFNNEELDPSAVPGTVGGSGFTIVNTSATNAATSTNLAGIFGGVEKIMFVKTPFASLIGTNFTPVTYHYNMPVIVNGRLENLPITRTVTTPDIVISAADLAAPAGPLYARNVAFLSNGVASLGGGISAQVIAPQMNIVFNKVGPFFLNTQPFYLDQGTAELYPLFTWGSYDGTSKAPVVYPVGSSVVALEQEVMSGSAAVSLGTWNPLSLTNTITNTTGAVP